MMRTANEFRGPRVPGCAVAREALARPHPGRPHDRYAGRFGVARRHIDQQPLDLPGCHRLEVLRDQVDVPVLEVDREWLDYVPGVTNVETQIVGEHDPVAG